MGHYAVIDIGTNTCNLLVAKKISDNKFKTLADCKLPVKMGRGGIHKNLLLPDAIERGLAALRGHKKTIENYNVEQLKIIATSAIRGAANRDEFLVKVKHELNWDIDVIDGKREAELIFKGATHQLPAYGEKYLIVDIGGGSNEFIVAEGIKALWMKSFNIGIARTLEHFPVNDPPTPHEIARIENWYDEQLPELFEICQKHQPQIMIGCSGAFDTLMDIRQKVDPDITVREPSEFPLDELFQIHQTIMESDALTRSQLKGMDLNRVEMIVIASVFTQYIIKHLSIERLIHTHFALKEGAMLELLLNHPK